MAHALDAVFTTMKNAPGMSPAARSCFLRRYQSHGFRLSLPPGCSPAVPGVCLAGKFFCFYLGLRFGWLVAGDDELGFDGFVVGVVSPVGLE